MGLKVALGGGYGVEEEVLEAEGGSTHDADDEEAWNADKAEEAEDEDINTQLCCSAGVVRKILRWWSRV